VSQRDQLFANRGALCWQAHVGIRWHSSAAWKILPSCWLAYSPALLKLIPFAYSRNQIIFFFLFLKSRTEIDSFCKMDVRWKHPWTSIICESIARWWSLWRLFFGIYLSCPTYISREFCFITRNGKKPIINYNTTYV